MGAPSRSPGFDQVPWSSLECSPPCQGGGRGFKSRRDRSARRTPVSPREAGVTGSRGGRGAHRIAEENRHPGRFSPARPGRAGSGTLSATSTRAGSSVGTSVRLKTGRSAVRPRPCPPSTRAALAPSTRRFSALFAATKGAAPRARPRTRRHHRCRGRSVRTRPRHPVQARHRCRRRRPRPATRPSGRP